MFVGLNIQGYYCTYMVIVILLLGRTVDVLLN